MKRQRIFLASLALLSFALVACNKDDTTGLAGSTEAGRRRPRAPRRTRMIRAGY